MTGSNGNQRFPSYYIALVSLTCLGRIPEVAQSACELGEVCIAQPSRVNDCKDVGLSDSAQA